jgi:tetratricopeptide (TPR) repeat protein
VGKMTEKDWIETGILIFESEDPDFEKAVYCFKKALKKNSKNSETWNLLGKSYYRLKNDEMALQCLEKALEIDSNNHNIWIDKGTILANKNLKEASKCFEKALELDHTSNKLNKIINAFK